MLYLEARARREDPRRSRFQEALPNLPPGKTIQQGDFPVSTPASNADSYRSDVPSDQAHLLPTDELPDSQAWRHSRRHADLDKILAAPDTPTPSTFDGYLEQVRDAVPRELLYPDHDSYPERIQQPFHQSPLIHYWVTGQQVGPGYFISMCFIDHTIFRFSYK